ncbi:hypothetical protein SDC9_80154 [bioreactor metagenome]|uniref:Uncharacterized protein n=1 Tax=bioreactor metagenome TaxID=1076179 RepID=A0A644YYY4_9ZZZZ
MGAGLQQGGQVALVGFLHGDHGGLKGVHHRFVAHLGLAALFDGIQGLAHHDGEIGGAELRDLFKALDAAQEHGTENNAGGASHGIEHSHAGCFKDGIDVFKGALFSQLYLRLFHAAGHADPMVAVSDRAVDLGQIILARDNGVTGSDNHLGNLLRADAFHPSMASLV